MSVFSRRPSSKPPTTSADDKAGKLAANCNNWGIANSRFTKPTPLAPINNNNIGTVEGLYTTRYSPPPTPNPAYSSPPSSPTTFYFLPGGIAKTIGHGKKDADNSLMANSVDALINLVKLEDKALN